MFGAFLVTDCQSLDNPRIPILSPSKDFTRLQIKEILANLVHEWVGRKITFSAVEIQTHGSYVSVIMKIQESIALEATRETELKHRYLDLLSKYQGDVHVILGNYNNLTNAVRHQQQIHAIMPITVEIVGVSVK